MKVRVLVQRAFRARFKILSGSLIIARVKKLLNRAEKCLNIFPDADNQTLFLGINPPGSNITYKMLTTLIMEFL